jgi:hypothetical protein
LRIDIDTELRDFTYITNLYKFIEGYHRKGHQIGRKIGDMLEILTMGAVYNDPELVERLDTEGKLEGFTSAGHKVEFGFYNDLRKKQGLFGAIECKCVGVEETTSGKNNKHVRLLKLNEEFSLSFSNKWLTNSISCLFKVIEQKTTSVTVQAIYGSQSKNFEITVGQSFKVALDEDETVHIVTPGSDMLKEVPKAMRVCKVAKLTKIENNTNKFELFDLLTGPQTIEKAKQASLVAMDLRRKIDGFWGKEDVTDDKRTMSFILVMCEFSHWEIKSRNVIQTCIDHNLIMPDIVLIKAFKEFEETFGDNNMMDMINKKAFQKNDSIRDAINRVINYFEGYIFYDIELKTFVDFTFENDRLIIKKKA